MGNKGRIVCRIFIEVFILIACFLAFCLFRGKLVVHGQAKPDSQLPPDLIHVKSRGCYIRGHSTDPPEYTLDAKTGEQHEIRLWTVTPFASYENLPDGTKREDWRFTRKVDGKDVDAWIFSVAGTEAHIPAEATDACSAWMKRLDKARLDEAHKAAH